MAAFKVLSTSVTITLGACPPIALSHVFINQTSVDLDSSAINAQPIDRRLLPLSESGVTPYLEQANLPSVNSYDFCDHLLFFIEVANAVDFAYS
ncbi:hypothetical protein Peur_033050 [Populus x canadensis]